jgi:methylmalonyl-CoA/ethylmalonyl-CoA epimerase
MSGRLRSRIDHVAVAVADWEVAARRWRDELGGRFLERLANKPPLCSYQFRYANNAKLELLTTVDSSVTDHFMPRFLARFGTTIHHLTLLVDDLPQAVATVRAAGVGVVDVDLSRPDWQEAFIGPRQAGGVIVQLAATSRPTPPAVEPDPAAAALLGVRLGHPDLAAAARLWTLLGARVEDRPWGLLCSWPEQPLSVLIEPAPTAGPVSLVFGNAKPAEAEPGVGPRVEAWPSGEPL